MPFQPAVFDPREFVRRFRETYVNFYKLSKTTGTPGDVQVRTPLEQPLREADLPAAVRTVINEFRAEHPGMQLTLVKHLRTVNGKPVVIVEDDSDLPVEERFLSASQTVTLNTAGSVHVVTDLFVAAIDAGGRDKDDPGPDRGPVVARAPKPR